MSADRKPLIVCAPCFGVEDGQQFAVMCGQAESYVFAPDLLEPHEIGAVSASLRELGGVMVVASAGEQPVVLAATLRELARELDNRSMPEPSIGDVARWQAEYSASEGAS